MRKGKGQTKAQTGLGLRNLAAARPMMDTDVLPFDEIGWKCPYCEKEMP